ALNWGLADRSVPTPNDNPEFVQQLLATTPSGGKRPKQGLPLRTWRQRFLESSPVGCGLIFRGADGILKREVPDDMPAPWEALKAVRLGLKEGLAAGLVREREGIGRLATTPACRNLVGLFLQHEQSQKVPGGGPSLRRVGVVGAGTMGAGIAQLAAVKGCEVVVQEVND